MVDDHNWTGVMPCSTTVPEDSPSMVILEEGVKEDSMLVMNAEGGLTLKGVRVGRGERHALTCVSTVD